MAVQVNPHEVRTLSSDLQSRALGGGEIIAAKAGTPIKPLSALLPSAAGPRVPGSRLGQMQMVADFDEPLPGGFLSGELP